MSSRSLPPEQVWSLLREKRVRVLDLRTRTERERYGAPPGSEPVSLWRELLRPAGSGAVYLCQHAVRSKLVLRRGAMEIAGGFSAWARRGLPTAPR